jgi:hypothetical protein
VVLDVVHTTAQHLLAAPLAPPDPAPTAIPGMGPVADQFLGWLKWILVVGGVGGLLICGIMMAVGRRNRSAFAADGAAGIPWVLGGLALGAVAATIVGTVIKA